MKVGLGVVTFLTLFALASPASSITLTERIQAQEKIERVYYNHRITLNSSGVISGTATTKGLFSFTVNVVDIVSCSKSKDYTIKITTIAPHN